MLFHTSFTMCAEIITKELNANTKMKQNNFYKLAISISGTKFDF